MSTDDLHTHGAITEVITYHGCGGELCGDNTCYPCRANVLRTAIAIRSAN